MSGRKGAAIIMPKRMYGKISDTFMRRLQLQNGLCRLADDSLEVEAWQAIAKHLAGLLDQGIPFPWLIDIVKQSQHTQLTSSLLAHLFISADNVNLADQLAEYIASPSLPDVARAEFLKVLFYYGYDMSELSADFFDDPTLMLQASVDTMLKQLESEPDAVGYILEEIQHLPEADKLQYVEDLIRAKDTRCLSLLYHLAFSDNKQIAFAAIKGLAVLRNGRALSALQRLQSELTDGSLQNLIAREERRLTFMALQPEPSTAPFSVMLTDSLIAPPEADGQQAVWLIGSEGKHHVVVQIVTDLSEGIIDAYGVGSLSSQAYQQFLADAEERHALITGANDYALSLLQNALAINRARDIPMPEACHYWFRRLRLALEPSEYLPEVTSLRHQYSLEAVIQMPIVRQWAIENPLVTKLSRELERNLADKTAFSQKLQECFEQLADKLVDPLKHIWVYRLRYAADYFRHSDDWEVAGALAQAAYDLEKYDTCLNNEFFQALFLQSMLQSFSEL